MWASGGLRYGSYQIMLLMFRHNYSRLLCHARLSASVSTVCLCYSFSTYEGRVADLTGRAGSINQRRKPAPISDSNFPHLFCSSPETDSRKLWLLQYYACIQQVCISEVGTEHVVPISGLRFVGFGLLCF